MLALKAAHESRQLSKYVETGLEHVARAGATGPKEGIGYTRNGDFADPVTSMYLACEAMPDQIHIALSRVTSMLFRAL